MDDAGLIISALVAFVSALMGSRTALALLCSVGAAKGIGWLIYPAHPDLVSAVLFLLDLTVLCVILRPNMTLADELIAALFVVAWVSYPAGEQLRYTVTYMVVVLQIVLTVPAQALAEEVTIAREFVEDMAAFIRTRLHRAIFRQGMG